MKLWGWNVALVMVSVLFEIVGLGTLSGLVIFLLLLEFGVWFYYWLFKAISMARKIRAQEQAAQRQSH